MTTDARIMKIAGLTEQIEASLRRAVDLRAERARVSWDLIQDPATKDNVASIAREIGEPEVRFRKSIQAYRDGAPDFKRAPSS